MKSNFEFLEKYWPALSQMANAAENYLYSYPNACMYKLGMFAERLVQEIMVFESIPEPAIDNTHLNRIRMLKRAGLLPFDIDNALYALRKNRNDAVHAGADSLDDAKMLLSMAYNLAVWFMQTYGDWSFNAEQYILPPKNDPADMKDILAKQEKKIEELTRKLEEVKTTVSNTTQKDRVKRGVTVSAMMAGS